MTTQRAALRATLDCSDAVNEMRSHYRARRDLMVDGLERSQTALDHLEAHQ